MIVVSHLDAPSENRILYQGEAKPWWGKLSDDDLERAAGKFDVFTGLLQEKYGYTREAAADEIDKRVTEYEANLKKETVPAPR